jgi:hypothetical protein
MPAGVVANDFLLGMGIRDGTASPMTAPAGWAAIPVQGGSAVPVIAPGNDNALYLFYRVANSSEAASYSFGGSGWHIAVIAAWSGVDPTDPFDVDAVTAALASTTTPDPPAITTVTAGALAITALGWDDTGGMGTGNNFTHPAGWTERIDRGGGSGLAFALAELIVPAAGVVDPGVWTKGVAGAQVSSAATFALKPAATAPVAGLPYVVMVGD